MVTGFVRKLFGSRNDRAIKRYQKVVRMINALTDDIERLSASELAAKTGEFRSRLQDGASLESLLPEAFAVCRAMSQPSLGMRHFDVQLIGGMVLNDGRIAEMRTGEGKTLVATLTGYLNALSGDGVHVITVNDYLARRDAVWMGRLYHALGLSVGVINSSGGLGVDASSFIYDPDYRRTLPTSPTGPTTSSVSTICATTWRSARKIKAQRKLNYAIVDEVDSILIDEAGRR
jgi:preprotein translocase subunit SecA